MSSRATNLQKWIDKNIGPLILKLISTIKPKNKKIPASINRIGVLKTNALGDTTLLSAITLDLKKAFPDTQIIFFSGPKNAPLKGLLPAVDKWVTLPLSNPIKAILKLRKERLDILFDFGAWPKINALLSALSSAKLQLGFKTENQNRHFAYDLYTNHSNEIHELENYKNLLHLIDIKTSMQPSLVTKSQVPKQISNQPYVVFHLWAGGYKSEYREWPQKYWLEIASFIQSKNLKLVLVGSADNFSPNDSFRNQLPANLESFNFAGQLSMDETLAVLKNASCVISVNTGIMHMAAALAVPTIGLSGPTNPNRWGPIGKKTFSLIPTVEGCGFLNLGFEYMGQRSDCMLHIYPNQVIDILNKTLI